MCDFASEDETEYGVTPYEEEERVRYGGALAACDDDEEEEEDDDEDKRLVAERERKKAEVRKRLEEAGRMKKAKKGFLTPERKKKLRKLLMLKAAEDLKQQQMLKEQERQRILQERILPLPEDFDSLDTDELRELAQEFAEHILELESHKYDLSYDVRQKDFEINELTIAVNDLRGKFVKPTLKKVSKTDSKFNKIKKSTNAKVDFRSNLKNVDTNKFALDDEKTESNKADWAK
uniref:Troponin I 4 n=1 Tax=Panagrellus redivivus TaxID=6233 RepID=A0A7E4UP06_PANRE